MRLQEDLPLELTIRRLIDLIKEVASMNSQNQARTYLSSLSVGFLDEFHAEGMAE